MAVRHNTTRLFVVQHNEEPARFIRCAALASNTYPKLYSQQPELKHGMVRLLCTTGVSHGLTPHSILDLARNGLRMLPLVRHVDS
jgi:hypothetical protein